MGRIQMVRMGTKSVERARRNSEDIEAFFPSGDRLTIKLRGIEDDEIRGLSENFGDVAFKLSAFLAIRFNFYDFTSDEEPGHKLDAVSQRVYLEINLARVRPRTTAMPIASCHSQRRVLVRAMFSLIPICNAHIECHAGDYFQRRYLDIHRDNPVRHAAT